MQTLMKYLVDKSKSEDKFHNKLSDVLASAPGDGVGLILSERIINMPPTTAPPSYKMLLEEINWANEEVRF
jgi:protein BCP1